MARQFLCISVSDLAGNVLRRLNGAWTETFTVAGASIRVRFHSNCYNESVWGSGTLGPASVSVGATVFDPADGTPNPFTFVSVSGADPNTTLSPTGIVVLGTNVPTSISVSNGSYRINGGPQQTQPGIVNPGDSIIAVGVATATGGQTSTVIVTIGGVSGSFSITTKPTTTPPAPTPLVNGQIVNNLSGSAGNARYFYIDVSSGGISLTVQISGGVGDVDLYVKRDSQPTSSIYDCRSWNNENGELCTFTNPVAGRYYILLNAYLAYSGASLQATNTSSAQTITFTSTPPSSPQVGSPSYTVTATGGASGNAVIFSIDATSTPGACSISGAVVSFTGLGTCIVAANQAGNATYSAAPKATQVINIGTVVNLLAVQSRKTHGPSGPFDLRIDTTPAIGGPVSVEPRAIGSGHTIVFQFDNMVTVPGSVTVLDALAAPVGIASAPVITGANNTEVSITLTGIPNNKRVRISLIGVNGSVGATASMGFLIGDVNGTRSVDRNDVSALKARAGQITNASNFWFDVKASGRINASDISAVKARVGAVLQ